MLSRNGARSEGYVQELFHEEAQQVCQTAISSPKFLSPWPLHSWSPLWQENRTEVTKLPFVSLCKSEVYDLEREREDLISRGEEEAVAIGKLQFPWSFRSQFQQLWKITVPQVPESHVSSQSKGSDQM